MSANQDPLEQLASPDRVFYATGVLLAADDFQDEQTYHRRQLACALAALSPGGSATPLTLDPSAPGAYVPGRLLPP